MRSHGTQDVCGPFAVENHHVIDTTQGGDNLRTIVFRIDRTTIALQLAHRPVTVEPDGQSVAQFPSLLQITHMTGMEQVETSVGENQPLTRARHVVADPR